MGINHNRPSQFMYTNGPGSILETTDGPVIVKDQKMLFEKINRWSTLVDGRSREFEIKDFEISERRLSKYLDGARLCRLPSNEELGKAGKDPIYPTHGRIPAWSLCESHGILYLGWSGGRYNACWKCNNEAKDKGEKLSLQDRKRIASDHAIRFVSGCHRGHLSDVPWKSLICEEGCKSKWFWWNGGGKKIGSIWIECNKCKGKGNLGRMWSNDHYCSGWHWHSHQQEDSCEAPARIQQRGSAGLWVPEMESSLDISGLPSSVFKALSNPSLAQALHTLSSFEIEITPDSFVKALEGTSLPHSSKMSLKDRALEDEKWKVLRSAIFLEVFEQSESVDLKREEFEALIAASRYGSPPPPVSPGDSRESMLKISKVDNYNIDIGGGLFLRIVPIDRLRVVSALTGFRREVNSDHPGEPVPLSFEMGGLWFPAMENFGEGVFIHLEGVASPVTEENPRYNIWMKRAEGGLERHPIHVWWHTLSHRLIDLLGFDSGFSSASIRERTYISREGEDVIGGVLLYTSQPGGDGTMGGLSGISKDSRAMKEIVLRAFEESVVCSNDPICEEAVNTKEGASCYACCMVSETSCEHRNKLLDRLILVN